MISFVEKEDIALIRAAKNGSSEAFTQIVRNYKDFIFHVAMGILQDPRDAEDVVQESFVKAYLSLHQLQDERAFPSWMAMIATRLALDLYKKNQRGRSVSLHEGIFLPPAAADETRRSDLRLSLWQALAHLKPEHRAILILREVQGFNYQEISLILDIPIGTVRSRLHTAREQLRRALGEEKGGNAHEL